MRRLCLIAFLFGSGATNCLLGQILYVGNFADNTISTFVIDQDSGLLTEQKPRLASPGHPTSVAVHPGGKFVYVSNFADPANAVIAANVALFSISPDTGVLTPVITFPLAATSQPQQVSIDNAGRFAFVANQGTATVSVFAIDQTNGALREVPGSPFATLASPSSVVVHPGGKFAYVASAATGQIAVYSVDPAGVLTAVNGSPFTARSNLVWMTMDKAGAFLYAAERQDNAVLVYVVNGTTGALTQVGPPVPAGPGISGVALDPTGKFLFASSSNNGSVSVFGIGATGGLTARGTFAAAGGAASAILDPQGKFLYVAGQTANTISAHAIDSNNGALSPLKQPFYAAGQQPLRGATVLLSPPVIPPMLVESVTNFHNRVPAGMPNAAIAVGARLAIAGQNIGPVTAVSAAPPLTTQLGGVSVQIQSGGQTTAGLMFLASNNLVTAVVPSSTPLGDATLTVTYNGRTSAAIPFSIVALSPSLRSLSSDGRGTARALNATPDVVLTPEAILAANNLNLPGNGLNATAMPGQLIVLQGMGLGAVDFDETQVTGQALKVPVDVFVGNKQGTFINAVRVEGGSDFVMFQLPNDVQEGCFVPVAIRAGGVTSNVATLAISASGASCSDATGLGAADIDKAQKQGQLAMGSVVLSHLDFGPQGVNDGVTSTFARYDFNSLLRSFSPGNTGGGIRAGFGVPTLGACLLTPGAPTNAAKLLDLVTDQTAAQTLNAGAALNVNSPAGKLQLPAPGYSLQAKTNVLQPGDYTVDNGTGNSPIGPFKAALTMLPPVTWTNKDGWTAWDRTQNLTVTWSGGNPAQEYVIVAGISANPQVTAGFLCAEKADAGTFTVPAWVLSSLPQSGMIANSGVDVPIGLLGVGTVSFTNPGRFSSPGLDFGAVSYEQAVFTLVTYN